jgi:hypothetical protein
MILSITEDIDTTDMYPDVLPGREVAKLLAGLPDSMDTSLCMVHCPADAGLFRVTKKSVSGEVPALESRLGGAHMDCWTVCPSSFSILPFCVESGHDQPVAMSLVVEEVRVRGQQDQPVDVVTCFKQQGQEVVQKQSLDTFRSGIRYGDRSCERNKYCVAAVPVCSCITCAGSTCVGTEIRYSH